MGGDLLSGVVEGFPFGAPGEPFHELAKPRLDEGLGLGVAVAATSVRDATVGEMAAEASAGELRAVVGAERELVGLDRSLCECVVKAGDRLLGSGAQVECPGSDLAGAAVDDRVQVRPAVLGNPELGMSMCQSSPGRVTWKKPGRCRRPVWRVGCKSWCWRMIRCTLFRFTGTLSSRVASAATIRVPSVGLARATLTIAASVSETRPGQPRLVCVLGRGRSPASRCLPLVRTPPVGVPERPQRGLWTTNMYPEQM